jgi:hypothetical protein
MILSIRQVCHSRALCEFPKTINHRQEFVARAADG